MDLLVSNLKSPSVIWIPNQIRPRLPQALHHVVFRSRLLLHFRAEIEDISHFGHHYLPLNNERDRRDTFRLVLDFVRPPAEQVFHFVEEIFERPIEMLDQVLTTSFRLLVTVTRGKPLVVVVFQNSMSGYDVDSLPFLFFLQLEQEHLQYLQCNYPGFQKTHLIKRIEQSGIRYENGPECS